MMTNSDQVLTVEHQKWIDDLRGECAAEGLTLRSDWEAARLALVCEGDMKNALRRVRNMRNSEAQDDVKSLTTEEAFREVERVCPGYIFPFPGRDAQGRLVLFFQKANFYPAKFSQDPHLMRCLVRVMSMVLLSSACSVEEFQRGMVLVLNAKGLGLKNFSVHFERQLSWIHQHGYPIKVKKVYVVNANIVFRKAFTFVKAFLSKKIAQRINVLGKQEDIYQFIDPQVLPSSTGLGTCGENDEQRISAIMKRIETYHAFEQRFRL